MTDRLKLFLFGPDTISAYSIDDAKKLLEEVLGYSEDDFEYDAISEMSDYESVTVTWMDGDFNQDDRGKEYPEMATIEFVAQWLNPYCGGNPRFELEKVSFKDGHVRVTAQAYQWAMLGRRLVCSSEY